MSRWKHGLKAALVMCAGLSGSAWGSLMVFDNPGGQFAWTRSFNLGGPGSSRGQGLDITQPSTQSGAPSEYTLLNHVTTPLTSSSMGSLSIWREGENALVANDGEMVTVMLFGLPTSTFRLPRLYQAGQFVGPSAEFGFSATVGYTSFPTGSVPLIGETGVVGVRLMMDGAAHYGWIHVLWGSPGSYRPLMWAYETEANTPALVTVPAPGAAALLGFGALAGGRRRR